MYCYGIDIGSRYTKLCLWDKITEIVIWQKKILTDVSPLASANSLFQDMINETGIASSNISASCATGYGRHIYTLSSIKTSEINCHAAGTLYYFPKARTIIDIGGQDSKIISVDASGKVKDFVMNDKCAAGTGRFLEMTAVRLNHPLENLSELASQADQDLKLTSTCVVFAESEIVGFMAKNISSQNIARAVHLSIAKRIHSQISALSIIEPIVFTGGLAVSEDLKQCLSETLGCKVLGCPNPEFSGALGAAIIAGKND